MRPTRMLVTAAVVVVAVAAVPNQGRPGPTRPTRSDGDPQAQEVDGKKLFNKECASCHGKQGRGNGRAGRDFDPRPTDISDPEYLDANDDDYILDIVANGKGEMDGIAVDFDDAQMRAIIAYVRELGEKRRK